MARLRIGIKKAVKIERQSGDGVWRRAKAIRIVGGHKQGLAGWRRGSLPFVCGVDILRRQSGSSPSRKG
jgi:hypothetical protein